MNPINHIAIIMDGNGRWGIKKGRSRNFGHREGLKVVEKIIFLSIKKKIPILTLFTFSSENWKRPQYEISFLFSLLGEYFTKNLKKVIENGIRIKIIGDKSKLSKKVKDIISHTELKTNKNKKILVQLALNYGSRYEIINAFKKILKKKSKISIKNFEKNLYTSNQPNPDILIRTGGQKRLSNFLLWQLSYTEMFFLDKLWPDFKGKDFNKILKDFIKIKRNFGKI